MSDDIREWARSQGKDIGATGPIPRAIREAYQGRDPEDDGTPSPEPDGPGPDTDTSEVAPKQPTIGDRAKASLNKGRATRRTRAAKAKTAASKKPAGPRVSIESILAGVYGAFAAGVGRVNPPVGMMMAVQAPVAGMLLEDTVKGSALDRMLQPFAKNADRVRVGRALFGPPLIVAAMQAQPDKIPYLVPQLRKMMADYIDLAGPKIIEIQAREKAFEEKYGEQVDEIVGAIVEACYLQATKREHATYGQEKED